MVPEPPGSSWWTLNRHWITWIVHCEMSRICCPLAHSHGMFTAGPLPRAQIKKEERNICLANEKEFNGLSPNGCHSHCPVPGWERSSPWGGEQMRGELTLPHLLWRALGLSVSGQQQACHCKWGSQLSMVFKQLRYCALRNFVVDGTCWLKTWRIYEVYIMHDHDSELCKTIEHSSIHVVCKNCMMSIVLKYANTVHCP